MSDPRYCVVCGNLLNARQTLCCSLRCLGVANQRSTPRECVHCGRVTRRPPDKEGPYCSRACFRAAHPVTTVRAECACCRKLFETPASRPKKHCSEECRSATRATPESERFWSYVSVAGPDDCWLWTGYLDRQGRGRFNPGPGRSPLTAARFVYELVRGPIQGDLCVCHNCPGGDNPACVNPAHLFLADRAAHAFDSLAKRQLPQARLTEQDVRAILREPEAPGVRERLAERFGVKPHHVYLIRTRRAWKHVSLAES